jgi:hypothetical protein
MGREASPPFSFRIDGALQILERTPGALRGLLSGLPPEWVHGNYGADTFSPFDVVGHLIHAEKTDWIPRLRRILESGEKVAFDPFDRFAQYQASWGRRIEELLDDFARLRSESLSTLRGLHLSDDQLELRGVHPELGTVTARELLATWVVHDMNHLKQIAKGLAWQYREEVGPWKRFLPILEAP